MFLSACSSKKYSQEFKTVSKLSSLCQKIDEVGLYKDSLVLFDFDKVLIPCWGKRFSMQAFDPEMSKVIKQIKNSGAKVGGLTKRLPVRIERLEQILNQLETKFDWLEGVQARFLVGPRLKNGILFTCPWQSKGQALKSLFKRKEIKQRTKPARIILVDDSLGNLKSVKKFARHEKIDFIGILYNS